MAQYEFWLTDDSGKRITLLKGIAFASISKSITGYGSIEIGIPLENFDVRPIFVPDRRIDVWRTPARGIPMRREKSYFLRKFNVYTREDGVQMLVIYGRSAMDILRRQSVVSHSYADYTKSDYIDNMMKRIVDENFITPPATAPSGEFSVDGDETLGPLITHGFFGKNVYDVLRELQDISFTLNQEDATNKRIFFDVVEGPTQSDGGFGYIFKTYAELRGSDRSDDVIFSIENGNLIEPTYFEDHMDSATLATSLNSLASAFNGSAESIDRYLSRWNDIDIVETTNVTTLAANTSEANRLLKRNLAKRELNAKLLDSPGSRNQPRSLYGIDWDLGDLVPVRYADQDLIVEVSQVFVSINDRGEENIIGLTKIYSVTPPRVVPPPTCEGTFDAYTVSLLHMDGVDGSTTFTDETGKVWTANGNAQIDTAQSKFGGASGLFDGTGDWIDTPDHADFDVAAGDFSVDLWFNVNPAGNGTIRYMFGQSNAAGTGSTRPLEILLTSGNVVQLVLYDTSQKSITATTPITSAGWHHVLGVRNVNTVKLFLDGVEEGTNLTGVGTLINGASKFTIGRLGEYTGGATWNGWIDEFRFSKGIARWTANFTPPVLPYCDEIEAIVLDDVSVGL